MQGVRSFGKLRVLAVAAVALGLGACTTSHMARVPDGQAAYGIVPPADPAAAPSSYRIVAKDVLNLQVFQEPELSNDKLQVDAAGNVQLPLIGEVAAAGRSPTELAQDISSRLQRRYIVNPQVVVSVAEAAKRFVAVEGQVEKPGVYEIDESETLLSAIARAESPTEVASLDEVVVFRTVDGRRMGARFDLSDVRAGATPDPRVLGGDVVVIGFSGIKGVWRDFLKAAPALSTFVYLLDRTNN